ncbi:MAG TPA: beta-N-acetylhexosaminidase [Verrucomicrobiae bacterium]|nr:beta-N-acetylhexosaminidase [Verrucomicrobiae bacterium]
MKSKIAGIIFLSLTATIFAADTNSPAIIPLPQKIELSGGAFKIAPDTKIFTDFGSRKTEKFLTEQIRKSTGCPLKTGVKFFATAAIENGIFLTTKNANTNLGAEGYELIVATNSIVIRAPTQAGLFYGAQTLLQLLPPEIFSSNVVTNVDWQIQCVAINDWPRFQWRGLELDVSRHFYDKSEVEKILDEMALHKLNTFHWHLTDDQGWRIEIKKYPKLTQIGAWRTKSELVPPKGEGESSTNENAHPAWAQVASSKFGADGRYGGFYTQDDIREVVKYAAARHITIVPEIEMPGHAVAALAAYPQFSCDGGPYSTDEKAGVNKGVFDPSNPATFKFLDDVLTEVFELFPGKYIHVGGDEVDKKVKAATWEKSPQCQALMQREGLKNTDELQSWFTRQIEKFVSAHGKTLIGWSEIADSKLPTNAAVMDWKGGGLEAASAGHDVVMAPEKLCYLDHYQSTNHSTEPHAIGGFLPLKKVYSFEPIPAKLAPELQSHILGGQCNLWTEYIPSLQYAEYMIFPRECALAEVTWSSKESRDWNDFSRRLQIHEKRLGELGVNFRNDLVEARGLNPSD